MGHIPDLSQSTMPSTLNRMSVMMKTILAGVFLARFGDAYARSAAACAVEDRLFSKNEFNFAHQSAKKQRAWIPVTL